MKRAILPLFIMMVLGVPAFADSLPDPQDYLYTWFLPYDADRVHDKMLALINGAHHKIRMAAYGFTDIPICDALIAAEARGIDCALVVDSTQAAGPHQKPLIARLVKAGVPVAIGKSAVHSQLLHAKFCVTDDSVTEDGSYNYSPSGLQQDNFVNIVVSDKRAAMFTDFWDKIWLHIKGSAYEFQTRSSS